MQRPVTQSGVYKILKAAGLGRDVAREALFVLRGSAPWTAGQYKGTRRALVREDGKWKNSPVLVWIGHSGEIWDKPAGDEERAGGELADGPASSDYRAFEGPMEGHELAEIELAAI